MDPTAPALIAGDHKGIVDYLKALITANSTSDDVEAITYSIDRSVASGSYSSRVFVIWIFLTRKRHPQVIVSGLRQRHSDTVRHTASRALAKNLRHRDFFEPTWAALGGAAGIVESMVEFSVLDVKDFCSRLGSTAGAEHVPGQRQRAIDDLLTRLCGNPVSDPRPLKPFYTLLVPAATSELIQTWERTEKSQWSPSKRATLSRVHPDIYRSRFLSQVFSTAKDHTHVTMADGKYLFGSNLKFAEEILKKLVDSRDDKKLRIPTDFMSSFLDPLIKRLFRRRLRSPQNLRMINLIVQAFDGHKTLAERHLNTRPDGLIRRVLTRIKFAREKDIWYKHLETLAVRLPINEARSIGTVLSLVLEASLPQRYKLMHLLLQHLRHFRLDIDNLGAQESDSLQRVMKDDPWPVMIFTTVLDSADALGLFQRLWHQLPAGDFLAVHRSRGPSTVWMQQIHGKDRADPEIIKCILLRNVAPNHALPSEDMKRAITLIGERRKKAEQSRESEDRGFWAKSTLLLCVAAGSLDLFSQTLTWARRFNKDALVVKKLYAANSIGTVEGQALLSALPSLVQDDKKKPTKTTTVMTTVDPVAVSQDVRLADTILLQLLETAAAVANEPSFQQQDWLAVQGLSSDVFHCRLERIAGLKTLASLNDVECAELIWKPTIDMLVDKDLILEQQQSRGSRLRSNNSSITSIQLLAGKMNATVLADLVSYAMAEMKTKLDPASVQQRIGVVVGIVKRLAHSDQPSLACSFIGEILLSGNDHSSWHRQLLNTTFLLSLPSRTAREFLYSIADAIKERLREQNDRIGRRETKSASAAAASTSDSSSTTKQPTQPYVKVTTVKMLAEILEDATFIDQVSSRDILLGLLPHAKHVDIHAAIVQSLLSTLAKPESTGTMRKQTLDALETYTVPVAARLNERFPLSDASWAAASNEDAALPDVGKEVKVFDLLHSPPARYPLQQDEKDRLGKLIFEAMEQSVAENSRWMHLFLAKNKNVLGVSAMPSALPVGPVHLSHAVDVAFRWISYMTPSFLEMIKRMALVNIDCPPDIVAVNEAIRKNPELVNSDAGQHWLAHYGSAVRPIGLGMNHVGNILRSNPAKFKSRIENGLSMENLQEFVSDVSDVMIRTGKTEALHKVVHEVFGPSWAAGGDHLQVWKTYTLPLLRHVVDSIDACRTQEWITNHDRLPKVLPDSLPVRARMLPLPFTTEDDPAREEDVAAFISELSSLIDWLAARKQPYHKDWQIIKASVMTGAQNVASTRFALALGNPHSINLEGPNLADYLRVELASDILHKCYKQRDGKHEEVEEMLSSWRESRVEEFRATGNLFNTKKV
ncbi:hypothetical protein ANO11243_075640 [Dothideomycetidae sp. 11243]|nr:hypothetical protein ANO11243_075640 [fungal sp. No.11243]